MRNPEERLIHILKSSGIDFTSSLPCEKFKTLLGMLPSNFFHIPLTREEEGVGISAGAALAGRRPAMFIQSSGIGNMLNALLSLTRFYEFPLALFISQRGIYKERIAAQLPMGKGLPDILRGAHIPFSLIRDPDDFGVIARKLPLVFQKNRMHAFLLSPAMWEGSSLSFARVTYRRRSEKIIIQDKHDQAMKRPRHTRYEILEGIFPYLKDKAVICNLGIPAKELFSLGHCPGHFYMLGSMGMATPIGLGVSLSSSKDVVVIDGDGSLLMNPGTLATVAHTSPRNLTILAIDNSSYGSTGDQPTLTGSCVDLATIAKGFGIRKTFRVSGMENLKKLMTSKQEGPRFIHVRAVPGNMDVPNITLDHLENKKKVMKFLSGLL